MGAPADSQPDLPGSADTEVVAPAGLAPGQRDMVAGRYRLTRFIAEGGMGAVYVAEHALSKKKLALKVVHPYLCRGRQGVERFRREVSAAAEIDHPGIVQVYDAGVDDDGGFFMAMELLDGESLGDLLRRDWPGMATSVRLVEGMLEPLAKAHAKNFIHRDLKPDNIFIAKTDEGTERVKLLDFGLAREVTKGGPTQTGITFGTPEYMSPEQAISARKVRAPGDVWAVGVMLYELLSGVHPFTGETPNAIMANAIKEPLPPLRDQAPHVPEPLARLVERCLDKEPSARPQDAGALLDALRAVVAGLHLDETVPSAPVPPPKWGSEEGGSSDIPISSSYLVSARRRTAAPTEAPPDERAGRGRLTRLVWVAVAALSLVAAGLVGFLLSGGGERAGGAAEAAPAPAAELQPDDPAAPSEEAPPERPAVAAEAAAAPSETEEEPGGAPTETRGEVAAPEEPTAEAEPGPADETEDEARPRASSARPSAPARPRGPSAFEEAQERIAAGDAAGARAILARRGRSARELALLVDLAQQAGDLGAAMDAMERYVARHRSGPQADRYRAYLSSHGR